jgi:hypothetical protein
VLDDRADGGEERDVRAPAAAALLDRLSQLGSVAEAEDVVQDAFLRYHRAVSDGAEIESAKVLSLCGGDANRHRSAALGARTAGVVGRTVAARAARRRSGRRPRCARRGSRHQQRPTPIVGVDRVARLFAALGRQIPEAGIDVERRLVNGQPGAALRDPEHGITNVFVLDIADGAVQAVRSVINADSCTTSAPSPTFARSCAKGSDAGRAERTLRGHPPRMTARHPHAFETGALRAIRQSQ